MNLSIYVATYIYIYYLLSGDISEDDHFDWSQFDITDQNDLKRIRDALNRRDNDLAVNPKLSTSSAIFL